MPSYSARPITISFHGLGGQGGGVLADWLVDLAEHNGFIAQATSVPGVAQRTGGTVYYVEMFDAERAKESARDPVLALMPMPGDVDLVVASELLEAGRAVTRGFVTPARTVLIASNHRVYSIHEKSAMGNGIADSQAVIRACRAAAKHFVCFDMQDLADRSHSVISAVLFGAIAGSDVLPVSRAAFEDAIKRGGVGVAASLLAFAAGFDAARQAPFNAVAGDQVTAPAPVTYLKRSDGAPETLLEQIAADFPPSVREVVLHGARRCLDYQDLRYAYTYLQRLREVLKLEPAGSEFQLTRETARYLALWMSFEDSIRVADLKTRARRFDRFRQEVRAAPEQIVYVVEFVHPRFEEICDTLPARLGRFALNSAVLKRVLAPLFKSGRHIQTAKLSGFLLMFGVSRLKRWRRGTLRFSVENQALEAWLSSMARISREDYLLAYELAQCPRLIKGYSDTHERGIRNFRRIMEALEWILSHEKPARTLASLRDAALEDESGKALEARLRELQMPPRSPEFVEPEHSLAGI